MDESESIMFAGSIYPKSGSKLASYTIAISYVAEIPIYCKKCDVIYDTIE